MRLPSIFAVSIVGFIITDQFYTAFNLRMLVIAAIILGFVWPDVKRFIIRQYIKLARLGKIFFTPNKYINK